MVALDPPFRGENLITLGHNILYTDPKPLSESYSSALNDFIMTLLKKDPNARPQVSDIWHYFEENEEENNTILSIDNEGRNIQQNKILNPKKSNKTTLLFPNGNKLPCNQILIQKIDALRYESPLKIKEDKENQDFMSRSRQQTSRPISLSPPRNIGTRKELYEKIVEKRKNSEDKPVGVRKIEDLQKANQIIVVELKNDSLKKQSEKTSVKNSRQEPLKIIAESKGKNREFGKDKDERSINEAPKADSKEWKTLLNVNPENKELSIETKQEIHNITELNRKENKEDQNLKNENHIEKNREDHKSNYARWMTKILQLEKKKEQTKAKSIKAVSPKILIITPLIKQISSNIQRNYLVSSSPFEKKEKSRNRSHETKFKFVSATPSSKDCSDSNIQSTNTEEINRALERDRKSKKSRIEKTEKRGNHSFDVQIRPVSANLLSNYFLRSQSPEIKIAAEKKNSSIGIEEIKESLPIPQTPVKVSNITANHDKTKDFPKEAQKIGNLLVQMKEFEDLNKLKIKRTTLHNFEKRETQGKDMRVLRGFDVTRPKARMISSVGFVYKDEKFQTIESDDNNSFITFLENKSNFYF